MTTTATGAATQSLDTAEPRRLTTETKPTFATTELVSYLAAVVGVLIAAVITDIPHDGLRQPSLTLSGV